MVSQSYKPPSPSQQLKFLQNIQRILSEGGFVATYKFALLHALADLSILKGDDTGAPLVLSTKNLAEQFFNLYERQTHPFPGTQSQILMQNTGSQAAIINRIAEASATYAGRRIGPAQEPSLISDIDATIRKMPLWKLQRVGDETLNFLYENIDEYHVRNIALNPGIAYCFRTFYGFITSMVQQSWIAYIRKYNTDIIGEQIDLKEFLFGSRRSHLTPLRDLLYELQDGRCFYTNRPLPTNAEVDHFIPWSRYPMDIGHNFVLASPSANQSKSDHIAAEEHLEKWSSFCLDHHATLVRGFETLGFPYSLTNSFQITRWCYENVHKAQAQVWVRGKILRKLSASWKPILDNALDLAPLNEN
ncbi:MAG: hypothetical protein O2954_03845 [bacterium]|nr:hypothetical protein [bacterium]